ncbi:MAG: N-succinylarginine dihydrolase [Rickettsiales bacterium]
MTEQTLKEVIFVGLPGPTHNYGGLSADNVASSLNRGTSSNPKQAALQALALARLLKSLGITAAILPPQLRPHMPTLREHFSGSDEEVIKQAAANNPKLLEKMYSSSAMWTANAATVTAAADTTDGKLHLTTANLHTNLHRRIEAEDTHRVLAAIFDGVPDCVVHPPLSASRGFCDEGAANHMRLTHAHSEAGLNVYVYGTDGSEGDPKTARQSFAASDEIRKQHAIDKKRALFVKQTPAVIDEGVFHNDVIAVSNEYVLLAHEKAYADGEADIERIKASYRAASGGEELCPIIIKDSDLAVDEAVHTYFFNSQIITAPEGEMAIIAPTEVKDLYAGKAARLMDAIKADDSNPITAIHYADLRQSMNNGGGPACLRLRVPMNESQITAIRSNVGVIADDELLVALEKIIENQYPSELEAHTLADPRLGDISRAALSQLAGVMKLPLV